MASTIIQDSAARNVQLSSIVSDPIFTTTSQATTEGASADEATTNEAATNEATTSEATTNEATTNEATTDGAIAAIRLLARSAFICLSRAEAVNRVSEMGVQPISQSDAFLGGVEEVAPVTKRKVPSFHLSISKLL